VPPASSGFLSFPDARFGIFPVVHETPMIGLGVLVVAISVVLIRVDYHPRFKMTSWTTGAVTATIVRDQRNDVERWEETVVEARFPTAGRTFEVRKTFRKRHPSRCPVGSSVRVRYCPADPSLADVE
jgi:hypothetical protein